MTTTTLPHILQNTPSLPIHRFNHDNMASMHNVCYLDVFVTTARLKEGVSVVGWYHEGGKVYMVMFEMPNGLEVFFHYSEGLVAGMLGGWK